MLSAARLAFVQQPVFLPAPCRQSRLIPAPALRRRGKGVFGRFAAGDLEARNVLIEHNLRLVAHIVKKMCSKMQISLAKK